jgi:hypothetical protein
MGGEMSDEQDPCIRDYNRLIRDWADGWTVLINELYPDRPRNVPLRMALWALLVLGFACAHVIADAIRALF